jgi:hypothetical protein
MASPFDALFKVTCAPKLAPAEKRVGAVLNGACRKCGTSGVFWSHPPGPFTLCEVSAGRVIRHVCRANPDEFEILP